MDEKELQKYIDATQRSISDLTDLIRSFIITQKNDKTAGQGYYDTNVFERYMRDSIRDKFNELDKYVKENKTIQDKVMGDVVSSTNTKYWKDLQKGLDAYNKTRAAREDEEIKKFGRALTEEERRMREIAKSFEDAEKKRRTDKANTGVQKVTQVFDSIIEIGSGIHDWTLADRRSSLKEQKNAFDRSERLFQAHMEMSNVVASNIITTFSSFATQKSTEAARAIAKGAMDEANAGIKYKTATAMAEREYDIAERERELELQKSHLEAGTKVANGMASLAMMFGPWGVVIGGAISGLAGAINKGMTQVLKETEFSIERAKQENEIYQTMMGRLSQLADKMKGIVSGIDDIANKVSDQMMESETKFRRAGLALGMSGKDYLNYMQKTAITAARDFGLDSEAMASMQKGYESNSGRAIMMTGENFNQIEAMSRTFGVSNAEVSNMIGDMSIFNTSIADSYGMMDKMYHVATKLGLSTSKFSKDLANNLKLAQKYNFKGGVENMAKLTLWAEKTRFNLQNATTFADKMMSNNIGDVIETSAKLQVLGGAASMFSDPMAMMWEAGNDVGALAKRQAAMFADITGTFDKTTGETTFTEYDLRMIKARAEAMGMNYEDVLNQKRMSNKQGVINKALAGYGLDDNSLNGIGQRALYSKERGTFVVNTMQGEKTIQEVAAMTEDERNRILLPENEQDAIMDIAKNARSLVELEEAQAKFYQAGVGLDIWDSIVKASEDTRLAQKGMYENTNMVEQFRDSIDAQARLAVKQVKALEDFVKNNDESIKNYRSFVENNIGKTNVLLEEEVAYLRLMASDKGLDDYSNVAAAVAKIVAEPNAEKRQKIAQKYADGMDDDSRKALKIMMGGSVNVSDGVGTVASVKPGDVLSGRLSIPSTSVTPINDGIGTMVQTDPNDKTIFLSAKKGGGIDRIRREGERMYEREMKPTSGSSNMNLNIDGSLNLVCNNEKIDIIGLLKNDSILLRQFTGLIMKSLDSKYGKPTKKHL